MKTIKTDAYRGMPLVCNEEEIEFFLVDENGEQIDLATANNGNLVLNKENEKYGTPLELLAYKAAQLAIDDAIADGKTYSEAAISAMETFCAIAA